MLAQHLVTESYADGSWWGLAMLGIATLVVVFLAITRSQELSGGKTPLEYLMEWWGRMRCKHPREAIDVWFDKERDCWFKICKACGADWYPTECDETCGCHKQAGMPHCVECGPWRLCPDNVKVV